LNWSERYSTAGDFQVVSNNVEQLINELPLETVVSLRESTVPMVVETHTIDKPKNEAPSLTVVGRSFETVLERRASVNKPMGAYTTKPKWMMAAATPSDVAYRVVRTVLGDVAQFQGVPQILPALTPAVSANDAIPQIRLTRPADYLTSAWSSTIIYSPGDLVGVGTTIYQATSTTSPQNLNVPPASNPTYWTPLYTGQSGTWGAPSSNYEIAPKDLYSAVMELLQTNHHGLKAVRPTSAGTQISLEVYNGADLTSIIVFDAKFDQFDDAKYLLSQQGSTNVGYIFGSNGSQTVLKTTAPEPSGLARRVLVLDDSGDTSVNTNDVRTARGLIELYKYNATALFAGEIGEQVAAGFNHQYFLGDILTLIGEYGLPGELVRVAEYIRTSDSTGDKAYPTFEVVS
jgi:hypothetical protein